MIRWIGKVIFWTYQRGSWQYDILCFLILVFIFAAPTELLDGTCFGKGPAEQPQKVIIEPVESKAAQPDTEPGEPEEPDAD